MVHVQLKFYKHSVFNIVLQHNSVWVEAVLQNKMTEHHLKFNVNKNRLTLKD